MFALGTEVIADVQLPGLQVKKAIRSRIIGRTAGSTRATPNYDLLTRDGERLQGVPEASVRLPGKDS